MKPLFKVGQSVIISPENENENYKEYMGKELIIIHKSIIEKEHPFFDETMKGQGLYSFKLKETGEDVPFSLYDYELELY